MATYPAVAATGVREWYSTFCVTQPQVMGPDQMDALKKSFDVASKPQSTCKPLDWLETRFPAKWMLMDREVSFDWEYKGE